MSTFNTVSCFCMEKFSIGFVLTDTVDQDQRKPRNHRADLTDPAVVLQILRDLTAELKLAANQNLHQEAVVVLQEAVPPHQAAPVVYGMYQLRKIHLQILQFQGIMDGEEVITVLQNWRNQVTTRQKNLHRCLIRKLHAPLMLNSFYNDFFLF